MHCRFFLMVLLRLCTSSEAADISCSVNGCSAERGVSFAVKPLYSWLLPLLMWFLQQPLSACFGEECMSTYLTMTVPLPSLATLSPLSLVTLAPPLTSYQSHFPHSCSFSQANLTCISWTSTSRANKPFLMPIGLLTTCPHCVFLKMSSTSLLIICEESFFLTWLSFFGLVVMRKSSSTTTPSPFHFWLKQI